MSATVRWRKTDLVRTNVHDLVLQSATALRQHARDLDLLRLAPTPLLVVTRAGAGTGPKGEVNPGNNLYVTNLSLRTRERDLEKLFGEYGKIYKAAVMYDPHNQESRGFAFVSFNNPEDADAARNAISGKVELDGKVITVELAKRGRARTPTPGRYFGPPYKREYDERDGRRGDRYGDRDRGDRYDRYDRYPRGDRYDDRRDRRDDRRDDRRRDRDYDRRY
ncbi:hypothetical protein PhCBS80983_g03569 [Powellomyces hirtus]|uniref:RRM domain-containing protein n=1 Tax=Powellomyces hirtus TaxID=109895 RepID=A0A507E1X9_9FUNG|nr:hypothetical protein DFJ77DRAFT_508794 [Powellomyces hirtus]TPX57772.1 hypothetical protein PhCBS80983_g03569 [Powellomyces hirtus]